MQFIKGMSTHVTRLEEREQPINWGRAFRSGAVGAAFMMAFVDLFYLMGFTPFSFEIYLGTLILGNSYSGNVWTLGFISSLFLGCLFGVFYGYCFEYVFSRSTVRFGIQLSGWHLVITGVAFFPFFNAIHEFMGTGLYPGFGFLGIGLGAPTFILIVVGHLLFGASMGVLYGPVRAERVRMRYFEPGETGVDTGWERTTSEDDPEDRVAV